MSGIARRALPAYRPGMTAARLLRFLTIVALALMPIGMMPRAGAMTHAAPAAMSLHCDEAAVSHEDRERPAAPQPDHRADCAVACSALPSFAAEVAAPPPVRALLQPLSHRTGLGVTHEAETPPPRFG